DHHVDPPEDLQQPEGLVQVLDSNNGLARRHAHCGGPSSSSSLPSSMAAGRWAPPITGPCSPSERSLGFGLRCAAPPRSYPLPIRRSSFRWKNVKIPVSP